MATQHAANAQYAWTVEYATNTVHRYDTATGDTRKIHPKPEFFGQGGTFAIAAAADNTLYLTWS